MDYLSLISRTFSQSLIFLTEAPALVRVLSFFLVWLGLWLPIAIPLGFLLKWNPFRQPTSPTQKLPLVASLYVLAPVVLWGSVAVEHKPFSSYGLSWNIATLQSFLWGAIVSVLGVAVLFLVQWGVGWLRFQALSPTEPVPSVNSSTPIESEVNRLSISQSISLILISTLGVGIWISITEELVFRGFLFNQLQQDYSPWIAATIASLIFAVLHLVWEGWSNIPQLPGLWLMGMVLSLARWVDGGSLGLACGLHAGWIWAIASLDAIQLIAYTGKGSEWLTGLGQKPLAGVLGILFLMATGMVLWVLPV